MIPHSRPFISPAEIRAAVAVLKSGFLSQGTQVAKFERAVARYTGTRYAVAVNSGTSALHLSLLALGAGRGAEVIIPSYVCTAVLNAVNYTGARPVVTDIEPEDFNLSPAEARRKITRRTKAIIVPHTFGFPADIKSFLALGIPVIEDCAQSLGATYQNKPVGSTGTIGIASFYATKMLTTGYGGMVLTNQPKLAARLRDWREFDNRDDYRVRYNYQLSDLAAALGLAQIHRLPQFIERRARIARQYDKQLLPLGKVLFRQDCRPGARPAHFRYVIGVGKKAEFIRQMAKNQVEIKRPVYKPLHRYLGLAPRKFPVTEHIYRRAVSLPIYPALADAQVERIIKLTQRILE